MSYSYENLVMCGGGIKTISIAGAIKVLEENGALKNIKRFAGNSAGSIIATLLAVGFTSKEIQDITLNKLPSFSTKNIFERLYRLVFKKGMFSSQTIEDSLDSIILAKTGIKNITFEDIFKKYNKTLLIVATCLDKRTTHFYHHVSNPTMKVSMACRISSSIPLFFEPYVWNSDVLVDGVLLMNYPLYVFDTDILPDTTKKTAILKETTNEKTLGITINTPEYTNNIYNGSSPTDTMLNIAYSTIETMNDQICRDYLRSDYTKNSITINLQQNVSPTDFSMDEASKTILYNTGVECAKLFFNKT